ncbi:exported hypothetical protein [Paraburkholderia piptadeniae]|uniref:Transmembrane protein n=1 Tax=Paraburkholderia piptadeniae TaxID=1701573 RepID=A0A1N7RM90_9BURK|nr:hypothetical protein [Paraburkholderia piptadeniae]SIT36239.1 exported hypothetical protein [Paraburkholderia piptadeniae]
MWLRPYVIAILAGFSILWIAIAWALVRGAKAGKRRPRRGDVTAKGPISHQE